MQTPPEESDDLMRYAAKAGIPRDTPWSELSDAERDWVVNGSPDWNGKWQPVVRREALRLSRVESVQMHIRVLLSEIPQLRRATWAARLKTESLQWRLGSKKTPTACSRRPLHAARVDWTARRKALPGLTVHDLMLLPIERIRRFFDDITLPSALLDDALKLLLAEVRTRLKYLCDVTGT